MTDPRIFDLAPTDAFAQRLEQDLLRALGDAESTRSTTPIAPTDEDSIMTIDLDDPPTRQRPGTPWKVIALAAAAIAIVVAVATVVAGRRDHTTTAAGTAVSFTVEWEHTEKDSTCAAGNPQTCLNQFSLPATSTFAGGFTGTASQAVFWNAAGPINGERRNHVDHAAVYGFNGTVSPCSTDTGQFMIVETIRWVSGEGFDGNSGTYTGTWQIVDDSGRNGLKGIAGHGESHSTPGSDARAFTGTVSCPSP